MPKVEEANLIKLEKEIHIEQRINTKFNKNCLKNKYQIQIINI